MDYDPDWPAASERAPDPAEQSARAELEAFFAANKEQVFYSRQIEVRFEDRFFHWITNRALRDLVRDRVLLVETRPLRWGGALNLLWHRSFRYYKRAAEKVVALVEEYSAPSIGGALGLHGESMVQRGFTRKEFVQRAEAARVYRGLSWTVTGHDIDFVFERDGQSYGVEVKNTLSYPDADEFATKIGLCKAIGVVPVFAARMLPRTWIYELQEAGGFALILKYQLYPWSRGDLAARVREELGLPVDTPRALAEGTMARFMRWHERRL